MNYTISRASLLTAFAILVAPVARGDDYTVKAKIHTVGGLSAHADVDDLTRWISNFNTRPRVHVVHGEPAAKRDFRDRLANQIGLTATVPSPGELLEL